MIVLNKNKKYFNAACFSFACSAQLIYNSIQEY
jgi:hypothetical protein